MQIAEKLWKKECEKEIYQRWKDSGEHAFKDVQEKPLFSIDTPPPYVNTPIHIGHATTYVLMDMFARFRRMQGSKVLFPLGLDRNGLPIEMAAEKRFNIRLHDVQREQFLERCRQVLQESSTESIDSFLRLGISFNSWKEGKELGALYLTDSPDYRALTQETFIDLWNKGLIYEDNRINNYCPGCRTTLADSEVLYENLPTKFNHVKFGVKETGEDIVIATTRPELICTCAMVVFNPKDKRYSRLEGKTAITPLFGKEVPIRAHPIAEIEKGTGLVMMCSAGDLSDIRFFREMNLKPVIAISPDGKMNEHAGFLKGLGVKDAREKIIERLKKEKLLEKQEAAVHRTPICERSRDEIEFIEMKEFYLKQMEFKGKMRQIPEKTNFFAPESRQMLLDWIDSISIDWPISRRRYYATEVPVWHCVKCSAIIVPPKGRYYQPWREKAPVQKCPKCGSKEFRGDERVFDTWFDSSISPLYIHGYSRNQKFFGKNPVCTLRPQGKEIIRTWLYYTLLKCYLLTGKAIFKDVWINYHILDDAGNKMSKSKGNVIDPKDVLERFGAEPFRLWAAVEGRLEKTDFRCSFERIEGAGKTLTKLWNVARFVSNFECPKKQPELEAIDRWVLNELNEIVGYAGKRYEQYDFHSPVVRIKNFLWEAFASHYLEMAKSRAYNNGGGFAKKQQEAALYTLHTCLREVLKLLAPVVPFITYRIFNEVYGGNVHAESFPMPRREFAAKLQFTTAELMELNSSIWQRKKSLGITLNSQLDEFGVPAKFKPIEGAIKAMHRIDKLKFK